MIILREGYAVIDTMKDEPIGYYQDFEGAFKHSGPGTYVMSTYRYHKIPPLRGGRVAPAAGGRKQTTTQ